jgi:hypothetical protein
MTDILAIALTAAEKTLFDQIELDALALSDDHAAARKNGKLACELTQLLNSRPGAIPAHRMRYFTDPSFHIGDRGASRQQSFERNGTTGAAIFQHSHFLVVLHYFIHGPDLPAPVLQAFEARIADCHGSITSSDTIPIAHFARQLARVRRLGTKVSLEEFFKLALEYGIRPDTARLIRNKVRTIR